MISTGSYCKATRRCNRASGARSGTHRIWNASGTTPELGPDSAEICDIPACIPAFRTSHGEAMLGSDTQRSEKSANSVKKHRSLLCNFRHSSTANCQDLGTDTAAQFRCAAVAVRSRADWSEPLRNSKPMNSWLVPTYPHTHIYLSTSRDIHTYTTDQQTP